MFDPEGSYSPQVKLMLQWDQGFQNKDLALIAKSLHKDYRHTTYPRSLGRPEQTRDEWLKHIAGAINLWTSHEPTTHSITEVPGKVIIHVSNKASTSFGIDIHRESIFIGHIVTDEDGSLKIKQIEDFTDSKLYLDAIQAIGEAKKQ